jgi:hypothetical protein
MRWRENNHDDKYVARNVKQENKKAGTNGTMWGKRKAERQVAGEKAANVHTCLL